jgi:hypothetical protein
MQASTATSTKILLRSQERTPIVVLQQFLETRYWGPVVGRCGFSHGRIHITNKTDQQRFWSLGIPSHRGTNDRALIDSQPLK